MIKFFKFLAVLALVVLGTHAYKASPGAFILTVICGIGFTVFCGLSFGSDAKRSAFAKKMVLTLQLFCVTVIAALAFLAYNASTTLMFIAFAAGLIAFSVLSSVILAHISQTQRRNFAIKMANQKGTQFKPA